MILRINREALETRNDLCGKGIEKFLEAYPEGFDPEKARMIKV